MLTLGHLYYGQPNLESVNGRYGFMNELVYDHATHLEAFASLRNHISSQSTVPLGAVAHLKYTLSASFGSLTFLSLLLRLDLLQAARHGAEYRYWSRRARNIVLSRGSARR